MLVGAIETMQTFIENEAAKCYTFVGEFLDNHPKLYKVCIVASHFFRSSMMFALMEVSPLGKVASCSIMLGFSFFYRASVERFCPWKFTLPSIFGAFALWAAKSALIATISKAVFISLTAALGATLGYLSLAAYIGYIFYLSHTDVQAHLEKKHSCCGNVSI
jgi:hypothetical protein